MIEIRDARLADSKRLVEIYNYYIEKTAITFEVEPVTAADFEKRMTKTMETYPYLVIVRDGEIAGYAYAGPFNPREAYQWSCEMTIYLDPHQRSSGLGKKLYQAMEEVLRKMGICNLYACIAYPQEADEYLTTNSVDYHAHLGYQQVGRFHFCANKFGRWYDMVWMEKELTDHQTLPTFVPYPEVKNK